jgi:ABC-type sugar transport system permease subunit
MTADEPVAETGARGPVAEAPGLAIAGRVKPPRRPGETRWLAVIFLGPAAVLLGAILVYPLIYTIIRSLFGDGAAGTVGSFAWVDNYKTIFTDPSMLRAVKNNVIWVVVAPTLVTILGLIFAVLTERIRWSKAFKTVLFMPMAISFLASGITFELIYADQPSRGLANAVTIGVHDTFIGSSVYPSVHPRNDQVLTGSATAGYTTRSAVTPGTTVLLPMTGLNLASPPQSARTAAPTAGATGLHGVVWNDFRRGGGGTVGKIDQGEYGLPGMTVQAVQNGRVVATTKAGPTGAFDFPDQTSGQFQLRLPASNFAKPFAGFSWLGPNLITPAIIVSYLWVYAGFAMVLLAAGMAAIPRDALEAARIDGATEWQVFRRITAPLLTPVLLVVFVTLVINVLKVFDLVFVISQGAGANGAYADVLAVSLYDAFGVQRYGLASAIGVLLVVLVLPAMAFNIRRFRREQP